MTHVIKRITRRELQPHIGERVVVRTWDGDVFMGTLATVTPGRPAQGDRLTIVADRATENVDAVAVKRVVVQS